MHLEQLWTNCFPRKKPHLIFIVHSCNFCFPPWRIPKRYVSGPRRDAPWSLWLQYVRYYAMNIVFVLCHQPTHTCTDQVILYWWNENFSIFSHNECSILAMTCCIVLHVSGLWSTKTSSTKESTRNKAQLFWRFYISSGNSLSNCGNPLNYLHVRWALMI